MRDEMIQAYPQLECFREIGFGNLGCVWSMTELFDRFIKGTPNTEFIHFCQDDILFQLAAQEYDRFLHKFIEFDPDVSCLKLYWHSMDNNRPETFKIDRYDFTRGWWGFGDCGILINRDAAKLLLNYVFTYGCFLEHIYAYFTSYEPIKGFYSCCGPGTQYTEDIKYGVTFCKPIDDYYNQDRPRQNTRTKDKSKMKPYDYYQEGQ